jgi:hypothetical protein
MSSAIDAFRRSHVYTASATVPEITSDLRAIHVIGKDIDSHRRRYLKIFGILIVPAIIVGFIAIRHVFREPIIFGVLLAAIDGPCIIALLLWRKYANRWYELRLGELVDRTLQTLSRDMASSAKVSVRIDMLAHNHSTKLKRKGQVKQWKVEYYVDPWLTLTGRLLDGSALRLAAITHFQKRSCWKKSRSGKSKLKTKSKESTTFSLRLRIKPRKYPRVEEITNAASAVQLPATVTLRKATTSADTVFLSAQLIHWDNGPPPTAEKPYPVSAPHTVAMMFLSAYHILNLSKAMVKAGKGR